MFSMEVFEGVACTPGEGKIAIVVSKFNKSITENLLKGALAKLRAFSVPEDSITVAWVPGAFELPHIAQRFALDTNYQAVICLGCVIKGETSHDEHINRAVSLEIARISAEYGIPIIFGLLTCNTKDQAIARSGMNESQRDKAADPTPGNKGAEAAQAALEMLHLLEILPPLEEEDEDEEEELTIVSNKTARLKKFAPEEKFVSDFDVNDDENDDEEDDSDWYLHAGSEPAERENADFSGKRGTPRDNGRKESFGRSESSGKSGFSKGGNGKGGYNKGNSFKGNSSGKGNSGKKGPKFGGKKPKK